MAVTVHDLYFSYNRTAKKPTLNGININCDNGSIYALLGPSGCGKTTLLDIIIGRRKPKSGTVLLYGYKAHTKESGVPGAGVGYMPQDIALQFDLTINEILTYFGTAQMMNANKIRKESERLIKAFHLPEKERLIGCLSGGQKRLVSLAVALLHKPRLLILDEPTVGVDPLLRISFWNHLIDLSVNENVTTIITTHYIDEAKRANVVAFMRKGEILSEGNPRQLIDAHNVSTLDDVFLTLCVQQGPRRQSLTAVVYDDNNVESIERKPFKRSEEVKYFEKFYRITAILIWKHFIEIKRNPMALLFLFALTFTSMFCVATVFGSAPVGLPVAWIVDETRTNCEWNECIDSLDAKVHNSRQTNNSGFEVTENSDGVRHFDFGDPWKDHVLNLTGGEMPYLPDLLKKTIDNKITTLVEYKSLHLAMEALEEHKVYAIIYLSSNFSENFLRCDPFIIPDSNCEANETINEGSVNLYVDTANPILFDAIRLSVGVSIIRFRKKVVKAVNVMEDAAKFPIAVLQLNNSEFTFTELNFEWFVTPGFLVIIPFGFSAGMALLRLIAEQESDLKIRNYVSGIRISHIVLADIITQSTLCSISTLANLYATIYFFGLPCKGSMLLVNLLSILQVLLGVTLGVLFGKCFNKSMLSFMTAAMIIVSTLIFSGAIWCVEAQPTIVLYINYIFPYIHSVKSMRTLMLKDDPTFYPQISNGFTFSIAWIAVHYIATLLIANFRK